MRKRFLNDCRRGQLFQNQFNHLCSWLHPQDFRFTCPGWPLYTPESLRATRLCSSPTALLTRLATLETDAQRLKARAEADGDLRTALSAIREQTPLLDLAFRIDSDPAVPLAQALRIVDGLASAVRRHVADPTTPARISHEFGELTLTARSELGLARTGRGDGFSAQNHTAAGSLGRLFRPPRIIRPEPLQRLGSPFLPPTTGRRRPAPTRTTSLPGAAGREIGPARLAGTGRQTRTCVFSHNFVARDALRRGSRHPASLRPGPGRHGGRSTTTRNALPEAWC